MAQTGPISPIKYASRAGILLGGYFVLKYLALMYWIPNMELALVYFITTLLVPVIAYRLMRTYRQSVAPMGSFRFTQAWSFGTLTFFFASIIVLVPHYIYYTRMLPEQFPLLEETLRSYFSQEPAVYQVYRDLLRGAEPIQVIREMMLGLPVSERLISDIANNVFCGAIVSLINAGLLSRRA